ncbi:hypothetical protein TSUD_239310, partial [Trifolium subterraneum]
KESSSKSIHQRRPAVVRVVVAGDSQTGKSSLIHAAAGYKIGTKVSQNPVLPPYCDAIPITLIDTSSRPKDKAIVDDELKHADSVVLTYACDRPETLQYLTTIWLPRLYRLKVKAPVIVVGCKLDLQDENHQVSLELMMSPLMQQFYGIEASIQCSAFSSIQVKCFNVPLQPHEILESVELTNQAIGFLVEIFDEFDGDSDKVLQPRELEELFCTALESPWIENPYKDAVERNSFGGLSLDAFLSKENKKYLVLREISEGGVTELLANKESFASCDIAVFVHDRSDKSSLKASELLLKIAGHGEDTGFQVPCLIVAAEEDQDSFTMAVQEVSQDTGVQAPMPIIGLAAVVAFQAGAAARKTGSVNGS